MRISDWSSDVCSSDLAGSPGFAWPEWRIDVSPGLFAGCGATSDGHAHRRMAAFRSSRVSLGIPDTATAPAVPYVSGAPTVTTAWRLPGWPASATNGDKSVRAQVLTPVTNAQLDYR